MRLKKYRYIRKIINDTAEQAFIRLKLAPIPIIIKNNYDNACYKRHKNCIAIGYNLFYNTDKELMQDLKIINLYDFITFTVLHEIAHYYQYNKFKKWYFKNKMIDNYKIHSIGFNHVQYRKLKLENNADKIAMYFLNNIKNKNALAI